MPWVLRGNLNIEEGQQALFTDALTPGLHVQVVANVADPVGGRLRFYVEIVAFFGAQPNQFDQAVVERVEARQRSAVITVPQKPFPMYGSIYRVRNGRLGTSQFFIYTWQ